MGTIWQNTGPVDRKPNWVCPKGCGRWTKLVAQTTTLFDYTCSNFRVNLSHWIFSLVLFSQRHFAFISRRVSTHLTTLRRLWKNQNVTQWHEKGFIKLYFRESFVHFEQLFFEFVFSIAAFEKFQKIIHFSKTGRCQEFFQSRVWIFYLLFKKMWYIIK